MTDITIYHNPRCSKSRQTLALLEENGHQPTIIEYLNRTPSAETLINIAKLLGLPLIDLVRQGESEFEPAMKQLEENQLAKAMVEHPKLIQRPIVVANGSARIGRPPESVLEIL